MTIKIVLYLICQRYKFESESQLGEKVKANDWGCI